MPRITFATYCERRKRLASVWQQATYGFVRLAPSQQRELYEYYRFTEPLSDSVLRRHWLDIRTSKSSLPQRASRSYLALEHLLVRSQELPQAISAGSRSNKKYFRVYGYIREEPDARKVARVLLEMARKQTN